MTQTVTMYSCVLVVLLLFMRPGSAIQPPNIVLIVADDLGWNDVGFHGSEIKTPNIDRLAYEGVILNNYYVSPICTPTRGSLMTGRHPIHLGLQVGVIRAASPYGLPLHHVTMAQHMKHLGFATHAVGKWHLGFFRHEYLPTSRGFDSHYGYWTGKEDYYDHYGQDDWHLGFFRHEYLPTSRGFDSHYGYWTGKEDYYDHTDSSYRGFDGLDFRDNLAVVNKTAYSTELYTSRAVDLINTHNQSQPLFLYLAHQAVHAGNGDAPLQAPSQYVDRFPYIDNIRRRTFAGMVAALDDSVGEVVRTLEHRGMMDNTIIVFTTDNGGPANNYDANAACNFPLRGTKNTMWEGGVHGVGFVHSPLIHKPCVKTDNLIHVSDWLPTLYNAAGGYVTDLGQIDGINQWDMLRKHGATVRTELLHNIDPVSKFAAIRVGDHKLVMGSISGGRDDSWYPCDPPSIDYNNINDTQETDLLLNKVDTLFWKSSNSKHSLHKRHEPYTPYNIDCGQPPINFTDNCTPTKSPCLFNVVVDPCEYNNIADDNPNIVEELLNRIAEYAKSAVAPVNKKIDPKANPALHHGVWVPWDG